MLMRAADPIAALRTREFARLDRSGVAYLDYTGAGLYPASLVRRDADRLLRSVLGNPHAESGPSLASTAAMERARALVLESVGAGAAEYDAIFTANASGAMRLLAEAFPFGRRSRLVLTIDNHNSVNGLAQPARRAGGEIALVPLEADMRGVDPEPWLTPVHGPSLFTFPAQSNFSGVRHPLEWVRTARARGYQVLLDAAAFVPSSRLDLSTVPADFVALSFYKMLGYPTGVGVLVARRSALAALKRRYFAGGTVEYVSMPHHLAQRRQGAAGFEDGTASFLAMDAVSDGLRWMTRVGVERVGSHTDRMTARLLDVLLARGERVAVYGPHGMQARGGTVAFNVRRRGAIVPYEEVELAARESGIAIRGGCFCNPGAAAHAFGLDAAATRACLRGRYTVPRFRACMGDAAVGAVRASVGIATTERDLERLGELIDRLRG
jgi:selenocysteine lyase/cysteine desulfurase